MLSHDKAFIPIGEKTGIRYEDDYDHYISLLSKGTTWAINVITFYNKAVFKVSQSTADQPTAPLADPPRSDWEDEFERELEQEPLSVDSYGATSYHSMGVSSETPLDIDSGSYLEPLTSMSATSDIREGLNQLSLDRDTIPSASALGQHQASSSRRVAPIAAVPALPQTSSTRISATPAVPTQPPTNPTRISATPAVPAQPRTSSTPTPAALVQPEMVATPAEPVPAKRVTRSNNKGGRTTKAKK